MAELAHQGFRLLGLCRSNFMDGVALAMRKLAPAVCRVRIAKLVSRQCERYLANLGDDALKIADKFPPSVGASEYGNTSKRAGVGAAKMASMQFDTRTLVA